MQHAHQRLCRPARSSLVAGLLLFAIGLISLACASPERGPEPPEARVVEVIDGDTIVVAIGGATEHVRLIGIDTPEVDHHGQSGECYGDEATQRISQLLPVGSVVRLARDVEARDAYGRLLAYVTTSDGTIVNLTLAAEGFADSLTIAPNVALADEVAGAVLAARAAGLGLWSACARDQG